MPNWATGTLKIRGTRENILDFCKKEMNERAGSDKAKPDREKIVKWELDLCDSDFDHGDLIATVYGNPSLCIWLRDSSRNFVDMDTEVPYYWDMNPSDEEKDAYETTFGFYKVAAKDYCIIFPFMAAWGVDEGYYEKLSKDYNLTFKVYTVEQGMGFFEEFEAKDGKVEVLASGPSIGPEPEKIGQSYGRFVWECPFPFLGG